REYHPDKTLPYLLPCDEQESERLLLQHYVIRYALGSNVIAPIDTSVTGQVLDCGCGPGTWVMEMATEYENLDFYGFDISPMYPSAIHPKNAHFSMGNILDPEIPFCSDSFVLVHQRNMLLGLTQDAWPGVVQDMYRCVLPGGQGWLQLSEVD
ncbi:S-adenosyl-L-methionine-dependent methyltransferase, partial [Lobosporangium transversale]